MVQLICRYDKCEECGHEGLQWGVQIDYRERFRDEHVFICHQCIKTLDKKLEDLKSKPKDKKEYPALERAQREGSRWCS
jgi:hypothetical protein